MDKIEIKNATIIDGLGGDPYIGSLYLNNGKIIGITNGESFDADISIDATGKVVTPGFIDLHTHSDISFLLDSTAQSKESKCVTFIGLQKRKEMSAGIRFISSQTFLVATT